MCYTDSISVDTFAVHIGVEMKTDLIIHLIEPWKKDTNVWWMVSKPLKHAKLN